MKLVYKICMPFKPCPLG